MDRYIQLVPSRCLVFVIILCIVLSIPHTLAIEDLTRIRRQASSCTDAAMCTGLTADACSIQTVATDCPLLCEDSACETSSQTTSCVDAATCVGLTVASCSLPAIVTDCPVLCDDCPKSATGCNPGFELVDTQCLMFSKTGKTWMDAKVSCENKNATLVMPMDFEFDALVDYVLNHNLFYNQYWVGASNQVTGCYQWLNGNDVDDSLWFEGYDQLPFGNFGNNSCVALHLDTFTSGLIASWDTTCSGNQQRHYICQEE